MKRNDKRVPCECDNCSWGGYVSECNEIQDILDRIEAGGEFPAGECPKCGALAYLSRRSDRAFRNSTTCVILSVSGGVADVIFKPIGVAVSIYDYDADGVECPSSDPDGERCVISHWSSQQKLISNAHWPIIRQAKQDVTCHCTKQWKCPSCGHIIKCSYEQIVQIGTPHCPQCETEMTMV